jgi:hypothetical protein
MRFLFLQPAAVCAAFFICGCQSNTQTPNAVPSAKSEAASEKSVAAAPEELLYMVMVDKLNVREQPSKSGKVITQFAEGAVISGTGEISDNKEEVTLRGMIYNEGYAKVQGYNSAGPAGWAYLGGLQKIYVGPAGTRPNVEQLTALNAFIRGLNPKQLISGKRLWDYLQAHFAQAQGSLADAAYVLSEQFLKRMEIEGGYYKITEKIDWSNEEMEAIWKHTYDYKRPAVKIFLENGFRLETSEGMVFPIPDPVRLHDFFAPKTTPAMKMYLDQSLIEANEQAWNDGAIVLPLDKLAERGILWENFNKTHPHFILSQQTQESERWIRNVMVMGSDNSPIFDYESGKVNSEVQNVWKTILTKYPDSRMAAAVKEFSELVTAEGGKRTEKVEKYINDKITNE